MSYIKAVYQWAVFILTWIGFQVTGFVVAKVVHPLNTAFIQYLLPQYFEILAIVITHVIVFILAGTLAVSLTFPTGG